MARCEKDVDNERDVRWSSKASEGGKRKQQEGKSAGPEGRGTSDGSAGSVCRRTVWQEQRLPAFDKARRGVFIWAETVEDKYSMRRVR